jgi:stage II sporulation protein R
MVQQKPFLHRKGGLFMYARIKKEAKVLVISLAVGLGVAVLAGAYTFVYSDTTQREIAENVLRFHVLAHSDDPAEQELKDVVRDAVLAALEPKVSGSASLASTRNYLSQQLDELVASGQSVVEEAGFEHGVAAEITQRFFPTVQYGNIIFPPGQYETLLITIGDGGGGNWWCLMFPPLCYVEMASNAQTRDLLEENVPPAGFALLTHREQENTSVNVRFRVVEWWQNRRQPPTPDPALQRAGR